MYRSFPLIDETLLRHQQPHLLTLSLDDTSPCQEICHIEPIQNSIFYETMSIHRTDYLPQTGHALGRILLLNRLVFSFGLNLGLVSSFGRASS